MENDVELETEQINIENRAAELQFVVMREATIAVEYAVNVAGLSGVELQKKREEIQSAAETKLAAVVKEKNGKLAAARHAVNVKNKAIDALFILAQHDGSKWAEEFRHVKDLCRATRAETGLWSAMTRVHYGPKKRTLLMFEARHKRLERVRWLLARAAPRDARDARGWTALNFASFFGCTDIVRALIASGAGVNIADNDGMTPLYTASDDGHIDIVRALIAAGADVNIANNQGDTPLKTAIDFGHIDIVRAIIAAGAGVDIADKYGFTPLYGASWGGRTDIVRALIAAGAGVNIAFNNGETPLYCASENDHFDIVTALIAAGADVNIASVRGRTPLDVAILFGHVIITNVLIEAGGSSGPNADDWE